MSLHQRSIDILHRQYALCRIVNPDLWVVPDQIEPGVLPNAKAFIASVTESSSSSSQLANSVITSRGRAAEQMD